MKKISYVNAVQAVMTSLAQAMDKAATLEKVYFDRGYNDKGSDPINDSDIQANTQVDTSELVAAITLLSEFNKFCNNQTVSQGDYASTLNRVRTDF